MKIYPVKSRRDLRDFIKLPYQLYAKDELWAPPLRSEQRKQFGPRTNPFLEHCKWQLFLLKEKGKVIGRIAAFIDNIAIDAWKERIMNLTDGVAERYGVRIRKIDMKRYDEEIQTILELSNTGLIENWGYSTATEAEAEDMAKEMKRILQPKGVLFAEDQTGRPIGYAIALPDLNSLLKGLNGHLFPFGFIKILRAIPHLRRYRLFGLTVIPEYQRKAVDSLLYRALHESLYAKDLWIEINYVLEDNWPMINAIKKLEAKPSRRYRIFEMEISDPF